MYKSKKRAKNVSQHPWLANFLTNLLSTIHYSLSVCKDIYKMQKNNSML